MNRFVWGLLLFGCLCAPATAQPEGASGLWEHYFVEQERTVYLDLSTHSVIVWSITDDGSCTRYPGATEWNDDKMRRVGQDWRVQVGESDLQVTFPDTTVAYQRSSADPQTLCQREDI
ncbi:MAG: hypothetical protein BRD55_11715 [Bacteroidetes bacterium SW_9_63_38]|nr:MAG: hypothetical protein BRD55_11715 [Bacteroidetes bacterium SW_9_63_38]